EFTGASPRSVPRTCCSRWPRAWSSRAAATRAFGAAERCAGGAPRPPAPAAQWRRAAHGSDLTAMRRKIWLPLMFVVLVAIGGLAATLISGNSPELGLDLQGGV